MSNSENSHRGNHLNTRSSITQPPLAPCADASSKQQIKLKYKLSHQQTGLSPHSSMPNRGKTNKNSAQILYYTTLTQTSGPTSSSVQFSSAAQSCPSLCDPVNRSTPGLPVHHQLPESTQTHVHQVSDAIQPSHRLSSPSPPALNPFQHESFFQ